MTGHHQRLAGYRADQRARRSSHPGESLSVLHVSIVDLNAPSGASDHVTGIATGLATIGHTVHLVSGFTRGIPTLHPALHRHLVELQPGRPVHSTRLVAAKAVAVAREVRPDIVYLRAFPMDYVLLARRLAALGIPYVLETNSIMGPEYRARGKRLRGALYDRFQGRTLAGSRGWVVMSEELEGSVKRLSRTAKPTLLGRNGFDPSRTVAREQRHQVRDRLNVEESSRVLVMAGFSRPWHGADRAIAILPELPHDVLLWLVGGSDSESDRPPRRQAARLGVEDRLMLFPWQTQEDLCNLVAAADVGIGALAIDRKQESQAQPLKTSLYLALGLPVLCNHRDPRFEANLPFVSLVATSDPAALAAGVRQLLALPDSQRQEAAEFARRELTWDAAAPATAEFLEAMVQTGVSS